MSVLVIGKFQGDTAQFRQALANRSDEFVAISDRARASGGIHHKFGIGDGYAMIVQEWESAEQFQSFFANPELQDFIGTIGAASVPPEIDIVEAIISPDEF